MLKEHHILAMIILIPVIKIKRRIIMIMMVMTRRRMEARLE